MTSFFALLSLIVALPCFAQTRSRLPVMGWSSWNNFRINISEGIIRGQADAMVSSGMQAAGYQYVNTDDGYFGGRDANGNLLANPTKFPSGMKALADYIHSKGLKAGIYSDAGTNTCGSQYDKDPFGIGSGLYNHDQQDLTLFMNTWGYDFLKVDWCGGQKLNLDAKTRYTAIGRIVHQLRPDAIYNVCRWQYPGDWVKFAGDSWRISGDISSTFASVMSIVDTCAPLWVNSSPGHFNDMDMLQVGRGMTTDEDKAHFTIWCMMDSPLLAGNDLPTMSATTISILTNTEVIALNQDLLCYQARRLRQDPVQTELWAKPLGARDSGDVAVTLLNRSATSQLISFNLSDIGVNAATGYSIRNLWLHQTLNATATATSQSFTVPSHGVVVLRIKGQVTANQPFTKAPGWTYAAWASQIGLTSANSDSALDPDGDGVSNLMEYAFEGFDPLKPDASHALTMGMEAGLPVGHFVRRNNDDVTVTPLFQYGGLNANGWSPVVDGANDLTYTNDRYGFRVAMLPGAHPTGFLKLAVDLTLPPPTPTILSDSFPTATAGSMTGWTKIGSNLYNGIGVEANLNHPGGSGSGNWAYFQTNASSTAGMFQSTGVSGSIGDVIIVNFSLGGNAGANLYTGKFTVSLWDGSPTGGGTRLNSLVASNPASGVTSSITLSTTLAANTTGNLYVQFNASNTAAPGNGNFNQAIIDNVVVTQVH